jgi:hypothetical protein
MTVRHGGRWQAAGLTFVMCWACFLDAAHNNAKHWWICHLASTQTHHHPQNCPLGAQVCQLIAQLQSILAHVQRRARVLGGDCVLSDVQVL